MPPIRSRRPGARVTIRSDGELKKDLPSGETDLGRWSSRSINRSVSEKPFVEPCIFLYILVRILLSSSNQAAALECGVQQRFNLRMNRSIGITGPANVRFHCQSRVKRFPI